MHALAAVDAQAFQQAVVGGFRRVGNVGDSGFVKTVFQRIHDLGGQRRAERFAFPVNDRIVSAGEVNFSKEQGAGFRGVVNSVMACVPSALIESMLAGGSS